MYKFNVNVKDKKISFRSSSEESIYQGLLDQAESRNITLVLTIQQLEKKGLSEKQLDLFNWICSILAEEMGATIGEARYNLLSNFSDASLNLEELTNSEFSKLILNSMDILREYYNINIEWDEETGLYRKL